VCAAGIGLVAINTFLLIALDTGTNECSSVRP
jgi:hypothetical protein